MSKPWSDMQWRKFPEDWPNPTNKAREVEGLTGDSIIIANGQAHMIRDRLNLMRLGETGMYCPHCKTFPKRLITVHGVFAVGRVHAGHVVFFQNELDDNIVDYCSECKTECIEATILPEQHDNAHLCGCGANAWMFHQDTSCNYWETTCAACGETF